MNKQKGLAPLLIVILIAVAVGGYLIYQKQREIIAPSTIPFITTFDECIKLTDSKIVQSYPRQCESKDGKTYIEEIKEPVDTRNWQVLDTGFGFSFKCPPKWSCSVSTDPEDIYVARAYIDSYVRYSVGFLIIKEKDFQQSPYRHPSYKNGVKWVKDLLAKNPKSIEVLPDAIKVVGDYEPVSDYPSYYNLKLDQIQVIEVSDLKAVILREKTIIPLNKQDLLVVEKGDLNNIRAPLEKTIISSIEILN